MWTWRVPGPGDHLPGDHRTVQIDGGGLLLRQPVRLAAGADGEVGAAATGASQPSAEHRAKRDRIVNDPRFAGTGEGEESSNDEFSVDGNSNAGKGNAPDDDALGDEISTASGTPAQRRGSAARDAARVVVAAAAAAGETSTPSVSSSASGDNEDEAPQREGRDEERDGDSRGEERDTGSGATASRGILALRTSAAKAKGRGTHCGRSPSCRGRAGTAESCDVLSYALSTRDEAEKRVSPFFDDLDAIVEGEFPIYTSSSVVDVSCCETMEDNMLRKRPLTSFLGTCNYQGVLLVL